MTASIYRLVERTGANELEFLDYVGTASVFEATQRAVTSWMRHTERVYLDGDVGRRRREDAEDVILIKIPNSGADVDYCFEVEPRLIESPDLVAEMASWPGAPRAPARWGRPLP